MRSTMLLVSTLAVPIATAAPAQGPQLRGYYLNAPVSAAAGALGPGGAFDFQRLRLMATWSLRPISVEVAYEQLFTYSARQDLSGSIGALVGISAGDPQGWIDLEHTLLESRHIRWSHRLDRSNAVWTDNSVEVRIGRQAISWATTLLLTPADPFAPFASSDPFREYRGGVDALRLRGSLGPFSELEAVLRPADTPAGSTLSALMRGRSLWNGWEISAWTGVLHDEAAGSVAFAGHIGGSALRAEVVLQASDSRVVPRFAVGFDERFTLIGRDLYVVVEYQHDGFGAASSRDIPSVLVSPPLLRGEMQVLGEDVTGAHIGYDLGSLLKADVLGLWDLRDHSVLLGPALSYSLTDALTARGGLLAGIGEPPTPLAAEPGTEFGRVPITAYVALAAFF